MKEPFDCPYSIQEFIDVPEPRSHTQVLRLSMSKYDALSQNEALKKTWGETRAFRLRLSPDGRTLALDPEGASNMTFSRAGVRTHHPLGDMLRQRGLKPPLTFLVAWSEEQRCWMARYDGLNPPPVLARRRKEGRGK